MVHCVYSVDDERAVQALSFRAIPLFLDYRFRSTNFTTNSYLSRLVSETRTQCRGVARAGIPDSDSEIILKIG